jgi:hypothetical protein
MTMDNGEQSGEKKRKVAKTIPYKVAKTLLYKKPVEDEQPVQEASPTPPAEEHPKVAKTILDHKLIMNVRSQFGQRENERLQQEILSKQAEPPAAIEPIEAQKTVKSCPFSWEEESTKVRFKHCGNCQKAIYHFDGLEQEQVDALVLKRENREKFVLYKRPDGKYMTSDCPLAQKKRTQVVTLVAVVCACVIASIAAFVIVGPPSIPTASSTSGTPVTSGADPSATGSSATGSSATGSSATGSSATGSSTSSSPGDGTHHYEAGDPMPAATPSAQPAQTQPNKGFSEQEQKGDFWQYPEGQPTDNFTTTTSTDGGPPR